MKYLLLLINLSLLSLQSSGQGRAENTDFTHPHPTFFKLTPPSVKVDMKLPISEIQFIDVRFDTSIVALYTLPGPRIRIGCFTARKGIIPELQDFANACVDLKDSGVQLVGFVKKLIASDNIYREESESLAGANRKTNAVKMSGVLFTVDFYIRQADEYIPLQRVDTIITGERAIRFRLNHYLESALNASLTKISALTLKQVQGSKKRLSLSAINTFNDKRFQRAILTDAPKKGIFLSFEDFLANRPSTIEFSIDKNNKGDYLYTKNAKGEEQLITDLWGYSDGTDLFIFSANNYFKLNKVYNSFRVYGAKEYAAKRMANLNSRGVDFIDPESNYSKGRTTKKYYLDHDYLQLDMDSGELF